MDTHGSSSPRGIRVYDRWGDHDSLYRLFSPAASRYSAIDLLELEAGDTVLEVGCGPGVNFSRLRGAIGPDGTVIGIDYSTAMVRRAAQVSGEYGWSNVHVMRGDATRPCLRAESVDAAIATLVLNTMPSPRPAIEAVYDALRPGGRFVVLGPRTFTRWPTTTLNPVLERIWAAIFDYQPTRDVLAELNAVFDIVTIDANASTILGYVAVAHKAPASAE